MCAYTFERFTLYYPRTFYFLCHLKYTFINVHVRLHACVIAVLVILWLHFVVIGWINQLCSISNPVQIRCTYTTASVLGKYYLRISALLYHIFNLLIAVYFDVIIAWTLNKFYNISILLNTARLT